MKHTTLATLLVAAIALLASLPQVRANIVIANGTNVDITGPAFWSPDTEVVQFNTHNGGTKISVESTYGPHTEANPLYFTGSNFGSQFMSFDGAYDMTFNGTISLDGDSTGGGIWEREEGIGVGVYSGTPLVTFTNTISEVNPNTALQKFGPGTLVLTGTGHTYTGETYITAGALRAIDGVNIPATNVVFLSGGVLETSGIFNRTTGTGGTNVNLTSGGFAAHGGTLTVDLNAAGATNLTWNAGYFIGPGYNDGGILILGSITANNVVTLVDNIRLDGPDQNNHRLIIVNDNVSTTADYAVLSGIISSTSTARELEKAGLGRLDLDGDNTYIGPTTVNAGTLNVNGTTTNQGSYTVANGATLGGNGSIGLATGAAVNVNGTLAPGKSIGQLTVAGGDVVFGADSTFAVEINGLGDYDQLIITGSGDVTLNGTLQLSFLSSFSVAPFDSLMLIDNQGTGSIIGTFQYVDDDLVGNFGGRNWHITYDANAALGLLDGGNDMAIYAVPEPSTIAVLVLGMLALRRRR